MTNFLFIVGVGRSGTSLLQAMLASHPSIGFLAETSFVRTYLLNSMASVPREKFRRNLLADERLIEVFGGRDALLDFLNSKNTDSALGVLEAMHSHFSGTHHNWYGDKDPRLLEKTEKLLELLPGARIVEIVRDPRDVLCSKIKAEWSKRRPWWLHVFVSRAQLDYHGKAGRASHLVLYEELVTDPEKVMRGVCEFLQVEYCPAVLRHEVAAARLMRQSESSWKRNTLQPILAENVGKWRTQLNPFQVGVVESVAWSNPLIAENYRQAGGSLPLTQRVLCAVAAVASSIVQVVYRWKR